VQVARVCAQICSPANKLPRSIHNELKRYTRLCYNSGAIVLQLRAVQASVDVCVLANKFSSASRRPVLMGDALGNMDGLAHFGLYS
jgi:hypothetical protein